MAESEIGLDEMREHAVKVVGNDENSDEGFANTKCHECFEKFAIYLCYICNIYICHDHFRRHKNHNCVKVLAESEHRTRMDLAFLGDMREIKNPEERIHAESVNFYRRLQVKHRFDNTDCRISALYGLDNKQLIVLDYINTCMKILNPVSGVFLRYVKFGSERWDVTEIKEDKKLSQPNISAEASSASLNEPRDEMSSTSLLAISFTFIKQIWLIDLQANQISRKRILRFEQFCWDIHFEDGKIFTICRPGVGYGAFSIIIAATDGTILRKLDSVLKSFHPPCLAIVNHRIYITDSKNKTILCLNEIDGNVITQLKHKVHVIESFSIDRERQTLYACGSENDNVYRVDLGLNSCMPLRLSTNSVAPSIRFPKKVCFYKDKLFIAHTSDTALENFITVVQIT